MKHFAVLLFVFFPAFAIAEHSLREIAKFTGIAMNMEN